MLQREDEITRKGRDSDTPILRQLLSNSASVRVYIVSNLFLNANLAVGYALINPMNYLPHVHLVHYCLAGGFPTPRYSCRLRTPLCTSGSKYTTNIQ